MNLKATLYLDQKILKAAKIKAAHTEKTLSYLVNEALRRIPSGRRGRLRGF